MPKIIGVEYPDLAPVKVKVYNKTLPIIARFIIYNETSKSFSYVEKPFTPQADEQLSDSQGDLYAKLTKLTDPIAADNIEISYTDRPMNDLLINQHAIIMRYGAYQSIFYKLYYSNLKNIKVDGTASLMFNLKTSGFPDAEKHKNDKLTISFGSNDSRNIEVKSLIDHTDYTNILLYLSFGDFHSFYKFTGKEAIETLPTINQDITKLLILEEHLIIDHQEPGLSMFNPLPAERGRGTHEALDYTKSAFRPIGSERLKAKIDCQGTYWPYYPKDVEILGYANEDFEKKITISRLKDFYYNELHFGFSENYVEHPDRVYAALFENMEFPEAPSSSYTGAGFTTNFTICEL